MGSESIFPLQSIPMAAIIGIHLIRLTPKIGFKGSETSWPVKLNVPAEAQLSRWTDSKSYVTGHLLPSLLFAHAPKTDICHPIRRFRYAKRQPPLLMPRNPSSFPPLRFRPIQLPSNRANSWLRLPPPFLRRPSGQRQQFKAVQSLLPTASSSPPSSSLLWTRWRQALGTCC